MATSIRRSATSPGKDTARKPHHEVALRIDLLIHTIHEITRHEEDLCGLMHELERSRRIATDVKAELDQLLSSISFRSFQRDLSAVERALRPVVAASLVPKRARAQKTVKPRNVARRSRASSARPAKARTKQQPRNR